MDQSFADQAAAVARSMSRFVAAADSVSLAAADADAARGLVEYFRVVQQDFQRLTAAQQQAVSEQEVELQTARQEHAEREAEFEATAAAADALKAEMLARKVAFEACEARVSSYEAGLRAQEANLERREAESRALYAQARDRLREAEATEDELHREAAKLRLQSARLASERAELEARQAELEIEIASIGAWDAQLAARTADLEHREAEVDVGEQLVEQGRAANADGHALLGEEARAVATEAAVVESLKAALLQTQEDAGARLAARAIAALDGLETTLLVAQDDAVARLASDVSTAIDGLKSALLQTHKDAAAKLTVAGKALDRLSGELGELSLQSGRVEPQVELAVRSSSGAVETLEALSGAIGDVRENFGRLSSSLDSIESTGNRSWLEMEQIRAAIRDAQQRWAADLEGVKAAVAQGAEPAAVRGLSDQIRELHEAVRARECSVPAANVEKLLGEAAALRSDVASLRDTVSRLETRVAGQGAGAGDGDPAESSRKRRRHSSPDPLQSEWHAVISDAAEQLRRIEVETIGPSKPGPRRLYYELSAIFLTRSFRDRWRSFLRAGRAETWHCFQTLLEEGHEASNAVPRGSCQMHRGDDCLHVMLRHDRGETRTLFTVQELDTDNPQR